MLREIQGVRQDNPSLKRRWYQDIFSIFRPGVRPMARWSAFSWVTTCAAASAGSVEQQTKSRKQAPVS